MAMYEVSLVIEGVSSKEETHRNEGAAYAAADRLAQEAEAVKGEQIAWNVYVTPHYCRHDDGDCVCVSWMPDHRPYRSG
jgi:hypothetical protein